MKTIELTEQEVEFIKDVLKELSEIHVVVSRFSKLVANNIISKLEN